jgi:hypothetical protein
MSVLIGYKILPIKPVNGIFDTSISIPPEILNTPDKKYAYLLSKVLWLSSTQVLLKPDVIKIY